MAVPPYCIALYNESGDTLEVAAEIANIPQTVRSASAVPSVQTLLFCFQAAKSW